MNKYRGTHAYTYIVYRMYVYTCIFGVLVYTHTYVHKYVYCIQVYTCTVCWHVWSCLLIMIQQFYFFISLFSYRKACLFSAAILGWQHQALKVDFCSCHCGIIINDFIEGRTFHDCVSFLCSVFEFCLPNACYFFLQS